MSDKNKKEPDKPSWLTDLIVDALKKEKPDFTDDDIYATPSAGGGNGRYRNR